MIDLSKEILRVVSELNIDYMPTRKDLENNGYSSLSNKIMRNGGFVYWRERLGLKKKVKSKKWNDNMIEDEIIEISNSILNGEFMPTSSQVINFKGDSKLHNKISKTLGYRGWAEKLGLKLQYSETKLGEDYEEVAKLILENLGYNVKNMSTQYPFDLLIDGLVKVDVKCGSAYYNKDGVRLHTFGINKDIPTCDIYIIFALDEYGKNIERTFVIPSHHLQMKSLSIGADSKYNRYINMYRYIDKYKEFKMSL